MSNTDKLYISYLDEHKMDYPGGERNKYYTILSITAKREDYINQIESGWKALRDKYRIPDGHIMHFADIKFLLNVHGEHKPFWVRIFADQSGNLDYEKLFDFFHDLLSFLGNAPFVIQYTGLKTDMNNSIRSDNNFRLSTYQPPYIALKEHLNLMGVYLTGFHLSNFQSRNVKITKLRYDGDVGFGERNDLKEAYHHAITLGTKHFRPEIVKQLFDEIRFIGKNEVGQTEITHAGNEIVDFITSIFSRDLWQKQTNNIVLRFPLAGTKASLDPLSFLRGKVINHQKLEDCCF